MSEQQKPGWPSTLSSFDPRDWPDTPEAGVLATCRLSDDLHTIALAGCKSRRPDASPAELEAMLDDFFRTWDRVEPPSSTRQ